MHVVRGDDLLEEIPYISINGFHDGIKDAIKKVAIIFRLLHLFINVLYCTCTVAGEDKFFWFL